MKELKYYENYLKENFKSEKTIQAYIKDIEQFYNYFKDKPIEDIDYQDIEMYKDYMLNTQKFDPKSVNRKLVAINQYLTYLQIAVTIRQVKIHTQNFLEDIYSQEDLNKILDTLEKSNDLRAKALIMTLQLTGMRISECLQITIFDIEKDTIMIIGKGNKRRNVFVPNKLRNVWKEYMKVRKQTRRTNKLFTGERGAITRHTAYMIVREYTIKAGVDEKKGFPHNLRHNYVKSLINKNVSIDTVADLVGHTDINVTRKYSMKTKKELLDIIEDL